MILQRTFLAAAMAMAATVFACGSDSTSSSSSGGVDPTSKEAATAAKGEEAVKKRRCPDCHDSSAGKMAGATTPITKDYQGNPFGPGIELYPPNLTPDIATGLGDPNDPVKGYSDQKLADAIRNGKDRDGLKLCPQMTHFAEMTDFEVYSIILYLRSLPPVNHKILRSVCPPLKTKSEQTAAGG